MIFCPSLPSAWACSPFCPGSVCGGSAQPDEAVAGSSALSLLHSFAPWRRSSWTTAFARKMVIDGQLAAGVLFAGAAVAAPELAGRRDASGERPVAGFVAGRELRSDPFPLTSQR